MKLFIGADHRGFEARKLIIDYLLGLGHEVIDMGNKELEKDDDFTGYATKVVEQVLANRDSRGILLCGSGQGMCMAANRYKGIRASLCWDVSEASSSRHDDNANVLCLSADKQNWQDIQQIINVWLTTNFEAEERYLRRLQELDKLGN